MANPKLQLRVRIEGRVQGVWYRGWTVEKARDLGLDGWVRNLRDGAVEAMFSGPEPQVRAMLALCRSGPPAARVTAVALAPFDGEIAPGFRQLATSD